MSWVTRNLRQTVTRWTPSGARDLYGNQSWTRSTLKGRWEDTQVKTVDSQGNELISNAVVYLDSDVATGDYLFLGNSTDSTPPSTAREVKNFSKIPSLRLDTYERKAVLR